jgi:hypothetical protein
MSRGGLAPYVRKVKTASGAMAAQGCVLVAARVEGYQANRVGRQRSSGCLAPAGAGFMTRPCACRCRDAMGRAAD